MRISINNTCGPEGSKATIFLLKELEMLGFDVLKATKQIRTKSCEIVQINLCKDKNKFSKNKKCVVVNDEKTILEQTLEKLPLDFKKLPILVEGESKEIRLWTDKVVVQRFKPTVYSYTKNRYGIVDGTDRIRLKFTSKIFRLMSHLDKNSPYIPKSAFLGEIESANGGLLVQRRVKTCNLETRIKRFHIGSPIHRYLFTEKYQSNQSCGNIKKWSYLDQPVVCFDWRHPLKDEKGRRLADEPLPDDYAALWINNFNNAKEMARQTFLWLEKMFAERQVLLIDMCIFIDRTGKVIYGEISPDCMRVRWGLGDPTNNEPLDKDLWRSGRSEKDLKDRYMFLYDQIFNRSIKKEEKNELA
jgi:phosphoribosylaminoimidazole-succinocarboxamide synthase